MSLLLTVLFGIVVGLALGLTGGGGSVFAIPLLVFGLDLKAHEAVTLALIAVTAVAFFGSINAFRQRLVEYRAGLIFAFWGIIAAPAGVYFADQMDETSLLISFAILVLVVASAMWLKASRNRDDTTVVRANVSENCTEASGAPCKFNPESAKLKLSAPCSVVLSVTGLLTGLLSGIFGVGGGFIIVPALTLVTQLTIHRAVATSLFVITLIGGSGVISGMFSDRDIPVLTTAVFMTGGVAGLFLGQKIAKHLAGPSLQKGFAVSMVVVALVTLAVKVQGPT